MHSIKTKIVWMTVVMLLIVVLISTVSGIWIVRDVSNDSANQTLKLLCETGQKNLNHYFESVEQSVEMVSAYVESDLNGLDDEQLQAHLNRVSDIFKKLTYKTYGVLTYYYRIDPTVSDVAKGFWYTHEDDGGFREHEVTDITQYDTNDTTKLVWFTVPKATGKAIWLPPYITDNLDVRVISYNVPVYYDNRFVGVIGIEIDYSTMADQVNDIELYDSGYAFINDPKGKIIYHPKMDVTTMKTQPTVPDGLLNGSEFVRYRYEGEEKQAVWLPLENGMRLNVTVPVKEINATWQRWSFRIAVVFGVLLIGFVLLIIQFANHITKPLRALTRAAEQVDEGDYDCELDYNGEDEVGVLTRAFKKLVVHLKSYIKNLNDLAYADTLTSVHNKGAFDACVQDVQAQINTAENGFEFAVCIFDCNDLKKVNDENGHDKGDIYLKETAGIICDVFTHSPVFRIGGDEFAVILTNRDYKNRESLLQAFDAACDQRRRESDKIWEQMNIARGMAEFDPHEDTSVSDVVRRADKRMYENKWLVKEKRAREGNQG